MKFIRLGALIAVLLISVCSSFADNSKPVKQKTDAHVTGHVIDSTTNEHIPYATVSIKGTTIVALTDATGHFLLKNLPVGKHTISVSSAGYKTVEQDVEVESNKTIEVKFIVEPQILDLEQVVVTSTRNETKKRESSTIVNVISNKLFEKTASNNVAEVLNFQSGLRVEYSCSNCGVPQLRINGLEGQYSQILLDSRPIFSSLAAVYGLEQLPASMVERVEVIRGGGSALFGSSAIGGVVNIITKEPLRSSFSISNNTGFFEGGGADINTSLNASLVTDDAKAGIYIFGMIKDRSSYDRDKDGFSEIPKISAETIGFRGYYKVSPSSRITLEYHHMSEFRRGGNNLDLPPHEADIAEQLRHKINGGGLRYDFLTNDYRHKLSVYTSAQYINRDSYFGTHKNVNAYGRTTDLTLVAGAQYAYHFNKLFFMPSDLTFGVEYNTNHLNDQMLGYNRTIDQLSYSYGGYLQNEWKNKQWGILIGARIDKHNKVANPIISPRANVRYSPCEVVGLRVSYSSGYRAPQAYEEDLHVAAVGGQVAIITIDPNLRPEYSQSVSASVDLYQKWGKVEANLLVEGFYTSLNDVFTLAENGHDEQGNLILERRNASGAIIKGINMELKLGFSPKLIFDAGFTLQNSRYKQPHKWSANEELAPQKRMFRSPDNYGFAALNYLPFKGFSSTVTLNYTGPMLVQHFAGYIEKDAETITSDFWDIGLRLAYEFKIGSQCRLEVSGGVKNIIDTFQRDIDQGVDRDAKYIYGPAMPRTYFVGLKFAI